MPRKARRSRKSRSRRSKSRSRRSKSRSRRSKSRSRRSRSRRSKSRSRKSRKGRGSSGKHTLKDLRKFAKQCRKRSPSISDKLKGYSTLKRAALINRIAKAGC